MAATKMATTKMAATKMATTKMATTRMAATRMTAPATVRSSCDQGCGEHRHKKANHEKYKL